MRLRSQESGESVVSDAPEGESPGSRWADLTKWLYGFLLMAIVGLAVWYAVYAYFHYDGSGQIQVQRTVVSPERAGRIQKVWPSEGDTVLRGDSLMLIEPGKACESEGVTFEERNRRESRQQAELFNLRIQNLRQQLARKRRELDRLRERRALELRDTESRQNRLEEDVSEIQNEISQLQLQERQASETASRLADAAPDVRDPECAPFVVSAPHDGRVYRLHEEEFTVIDAGTPVLSMVRPSSSVTVLGYLDRDLTGYVQQGDSVSVYLPGRARTQGVVRETYSTARDFAQVKYDVYKPYPTQLLAKIAPADEGTEDRWRELDRAEVKVEGRISR